MANEQNYKNHVRWFPLMHFVVVPLLLLNLIWQIVLLYQAPGWNRGEAVLFALTIILLGIAARLQSIKAQDRVIRLEERLRYHNLLSSETAEAASANLSLNEMIALRFACDEELPELIERALKREFARPRDIKIAVKKWRPDYVRV
jgi:glucan phosphoethanolaminetransferase (alkaline phosphatase superfamily)